ncbi:hypothetical protein AVEN_135007-1 [Araneus ventricosus]|uniref:Endonuclease/exonuclease/phosphatase domain-containing protein n=1 Tax=Araneus ventricosus TaxID=182803 RepID=A0A4Y2G4J5_ARAVE|nr:hypothetical protein AVEN_135007-1 [Araneus ventricosus]
MSSDHNPILLNLFLKYSVPKITGKLTTNWNLFTSSLNKIEIQNPYDISTPTQLDKYVRDLESQINHAKLSASKPIKANTTYVDARLKELAAEHLKLESESLTKKLTNVNFEDGTIWKFVRPFKKKYKKINPLPSPACIANTDDEKDDCLANSLELQFSLNNIPHPDIEETVIGSVTCFRLENNMGTVLIDSSSPLK